MRLALAGTGSLAQDLLLAVQQTEDVEVTAIYHHSPDPDAARELAERYGIKEVYSDYSRMVRMAKADFVYIALVNDAHFEYAKEALEHGLNVIVEKPMCPTAKEVKLLADMAWERELFLFEAVTTLHTQNYRSLRDMVKQLGSGWCCATSHRDRAATTGIGQGWWLRLFPRSILAVPCTISMYTISILW